VNQERISLDDGDFIDLLHVPGNTDAPRVLLLHGLEGSQRSHYIKGMLSALATHGYAATLMHFRGCSGETNRKARAYHSGDTDDLSAILSLLHQREPRRPIIAIGYSLGGNVLLKHLGERGADSQLHAAAAVSVPLRLDLAANRLTSGASRFYQWRLLKQLRCNYRDKFKNRTDAPFSLDRLGELDTFWKFDNEITAPLHDFRDVDDYYEQCSSRQFLGTISTPTLILHAMDDPFMSHDIVPAETELADSVRMEVSAHGGHVGFIQGNIPGRAKYWLEQRLIDFVHDYSD